MLKFGIILLIFGGAIVLALWVTFDEPQGTAVTAGQFPRLVSEIDDLQQRLATIPIHRTIIVAEFNAFVSQTPRLGVFGWQRNTLALGLDLMLALSQQEARAVIAHELGHLSRNHSKFAGWIYRVRRTWANLFTKFKENQRWGAGLINRFFYWYVPRFDANSFALCRQDEYEADAASAELTSQQTAGEALMKISIIGAYLDHRHWRVFHAQAHHRPEPQRMAYAALAHDLRASPLATDDLVRYREVALGRKTDCEDSYPSLTDRLNGLGLDPARFNIGPMNRGDSAAVAWLGPELPRLIAEYDRVWWQRNADDWRERHEKVQGELAEMRELTALPKDSLEQMQIWRLGVLTARHVGEGEALPVFRSYQARFPDDFDAGIVIGRLLSNANDPSCLDEWRAIPRDHAGFVEANSEAADFLEAQGHAAEAEHHRIIARQRAEEMQSAKTERTEVSADDTFKVPALSPTNLADIKSGLQGLGVVGSAWLAEKEVRHDHGMPIYILATRTKFLHHARITSLDAEQSSFNAVLDHFSDSICAVRDASGLDHARQARQAGKKAQHPPSLILPRPQAPTESG